MDDLTQLVRGELGKVRENVDQFCASQKTKTKELADKQSEIFARLLEAEQRIARGGGEGGGGGYDVGNRGHELRAMLEGSDDLKAVADRKSRRAVIEMPANYFNVRAALTSGAIVPPDVRPGIVAPATRRLTIRSLLPSVSTDSGSVQYLREDSFDNQASTVSEGDLKPESSISMSLQTSSIVVLAHFVVVTNQVLSDVNMLQQYIETRLRFGLSFVLETQLLRGSGVGNNLPGLMTQATAYAGPSGSRIDILREAINQLSLTEFSASVIVLHPSDWKAITLLKDNTGRYLASDPAAATTPMLWGVPIVVTSAMTFDSFLVMDAAQGALIFDREQMRFDVSTEDSDNFRRNLATLRVEERLGLGILRPLAIVKGDFSTS